MAFSKDVAHRNILDIKLEILCSSSRWEKSINFDSVVILTDQHIDQHQRILLSFGLNFSLGSDNKDFINSMIQINRFDYKYPDVNINCLKGLCFQTFMSRNNKATFPRRFQLALDRLSKNKRDQSDESRQGWSCRSYGCH